MYVCVYRYVCVCECVSVCVGRDRNREREARGLEGSSLNYGDRKRLLMTERGRESEKKCAIMREKVCE